MGTYNYDKVAELYRTLKEDEHLLPIFYTNDYPIPFKSFKLYPVQVDMFYFFNMFSQCLLLPHMTSGDINAIQLSYLKYLFYLITEKQKPEIAFQLTELLSMVFKVSKETKIDLLLDTGEILIGNEKITDKEFDKLRQIILEQNNLELPDETIDPEALKAYKELQEYKANHQGFKMCSFEEQINVVVACTSYKRDEVMGMTIRSFTRLYNRSNKIIEYKLATLLSPMMKEDARNKLEHYLADTDKTFKEKYREAMTDMGSLENKING